MNYKKIIDSLNWTHVLLIFGALILLHFLAFHSPSTITERQGLVGSLGWLGGSALLGYILISVGLIVLRFQPLVGLIIAAVGFVLAGISFAVIWVWVKNNWMIAAGILVALLLLMYYFKRQRKPQEIIYYVNR